MENNPETLEILLVEDNEGDIILTKEALSETSVPNRLHVARDGEEGLAFLFKEGKFENVPTPDLILLDLNMPRKDGKEVLSEIKQHPELKVIPVVVLTTSNAKKDITTCYELQANCYINKPLDFQQFSKVIDIIEQFWMSLVLLPTRQ